MLRGTLRAGAGPAPPLCAGADPAGRQRRRGPAACRSPWALRPLAQAPWHPCTGSAGWTPPPDTRRVSKSRERPLSPVATQQTLRSRQARIEPGRGVARLPACGEQHRGATPTVTPMLITQLPAESLPDQRKKKSGRSKKRRRAGIARSTVPEPSTSAASRQLPMSAGSQEEQNRPCLSQTAVLVLPGIFFSLQPPSPPSLSCTNRMATTGLGASPATTGLGSTSAGMGAGTYGARRSAGAACLLRSRRVHAVRESGFPHEMQAGSS